MINSVLLALLFLFGSSLMTGIISSLQRLGKSQAEALAKNQKGLAQFFFTKTHRDLLSYTLSFSKSILLIGYTLTAFDFSYKFLPPEPTWKSFLLLLLILFSISILSDFLFRAISLLKPRVFFRAFCQVTSLFLLLFWPLSLFFFKLLQFLPLSKEIFSFRIKEKILEILHDSEFAPYLDPNDQKLILSVVSFKERIAREVMVPRIDMFTLSADISIKEAAKGFLEEGYSRIPVWKESVDNIIGALYYKDLLNVYFTHETEKNQLDTSIESLLKPVVYAPETKKISVLLQEFRNKQIHLAIVVDEYGGTEGIVTIEDILEELVGEIADEYDYDEEALYSPLPSGGWIVDAKMSIIDIEEELGIKIPQSPEYDTVGGYIFHKAGSIPPKGWRLHQDEFDIEVLSSSERTIEKIRITVHYTQTK